MSFNILTTADIKEVSNLLLELVKIEEDKTRQDMKSYLNKTTLSEEAKLKEYAQFSKDLFTTKLQATLSTAQQYIISDAQLNQQKQVNTAQIELTNSQKDVAVQEELNAKEQNKLLVKQTAQVAKETDFTNTKIWLALMESKVKADLTVAQTLSEARRNGADVTKVDRTYTDTATGQTVTYAHISLAAASSTDTTKGLLGLQMLLADKQAESFGSHTKLSIAQQIGQTIEQCIANDYTAITGLMTSQRNIYGDILGGTTLLSSDLTIA